MEEQFSILIVDDNEMISEPLGLLLELQGYEISVALNGRLAIDMIHKNEPDLILLDIMMPVMNGYETLEYLKADSALRHIPIIMLTALDEMGSVVKCIKLGAEDYLIKPFDSTLLNARIDASLDRKRWHDQEQAYIKQIENEKQKSEALLLNILPGPISERLKQGQNIIADGFEAVSVLFADIVNFTQLSSHLSPAEIVELLNEIFTTFDYLAEDHDLEKIKTIGDEYMVVGGLPIPREDHAEAVANMALAMRAAIVIVGQKFKIPLSIRIGISSGPVVAGVIGKKKFAYDLWGDTVNTASRMETYSPANCIQVSADTYVHIKDKYYFEPREQIEVKGKGMMSTFLLQGKQNYES